MSLLSERKNSSPFGLTKASMWLMDELEYHPRLRAKLTKLNSEYVARLEIASLLEKHSDYMMKLVRADFEYRIKALKAPRDIETLSLNVFAARYRDISKRSIKVKKSLIENEKNYMRDTIFWVCIDWILLVSSIILSVFNQTWFAMTLLLALVILNLSNTPWAIKKRWSDIDFF